MVTLTNDEVTSLLDLIESNLFDVIRNDVEIDNVDWLANIMSIYAKCKKDQDGGQT